MKFGKGRHKVMPNIRGCFSHAYAKVHHVPLFFKEDDFIRSDIRLA
jgi:ribonuclease VapC